MTRTTPTGSEPNPDDLELAKSRVRDVLSHRLVATVRMLEHEISDVGGPSLEPRILGIARKTLVRDGELTEVFRTNAPSWFHLADALPKDVDARVATLEPVFHEIDELPARRRRGQCLELAIYRALAQSNADYFGRFPGFDPSDSERKSHYRKEEPPAYIGDRTIPREGPLDFLYIHSTEGFAGVEAKNIREWLYPWAAEVKGLLSKCVALDCVPVLVARRFPMVTGEVLEKSGVVLHPTLNQLYHVADKELAGRAMQPDLLGFGDIRVGDEPDDRLSHFIGTTLREVLPDARAHFDEFKDLLSVYANGEVQYREFARRVLLRAAGKNEADWEDEEHGHPHGEY